MIKAIIVALYPMDAEKIKGGVQAVSVNLVKGFVPISEIDLKIFAIDRNIREDCQENISENITIYYNSYGKIKSTKYALLVHLRKKLRQLIQDFNPDVIHIQGNGSQLLLTYNLDRKKIIITQHAILSEELKTQSSLKSKLSFIINMGIESIMMPRIRNHLFISDYNRRLLKRPTSAKDKAALIYNPVNATFFDIEVTSMKVNRLIYIGSLIKRKGLMDLLKTLKILNYQKVNFHLDIVGGVVEASYAQELDDFIANNSLSESVKLHGWLSQRDIIKLYEQVQILVLPSYQETLPVCISEALAAGRIVVATNVGGIAEMIENGVSGFLYEKGDITALTRILSDLYLNTTAYKLISGQARKRAQQKYEPKNIAQQTLHFYKQVARYNTLA